MLSIHAINNIGYYLEENDYYLSDEEVTGIWIGKGAIALGLSGLLTESDYRKLMQGYAQDGKTPLCATPGEDHRPGWDLTFSAPKSVSLVWATADEALRERISEAQLIAVRQAISLLEMHAAHTRRGQGGRCREQVDGLVVATFEHETSRSLDPQLHTHALVANVAPRLDGTWGTIVSRDLFLWQKAAGAIYRAELAYQLGQMGFSVEQDRESFQLSCVPEFVCLHFSKRAQAIIEMLKQASVESSASSIGNQVKIFTRQAKQRVDRAELLADWQTELGGFGLTSDFIEQNRVNQCAGAGLPDIADICSALTDKVAIFRKQDVYRLAAEQLQYSMLSADEIIEFASAALDDEELIPLGEDEKHNLLFTTRQIVRMEKELVAAAKTLWSEGKHQLTETVVKEAISLKGQQCGYLLSDEQQSALMNACCDGDFAILQGSAGAGKSSAMEALRLAYEMSGHAVIGAAIAKRAADNLHDEASIPSFTIAKLLSDFGRGRNRFSSADVLVIDEAGQIGTKQLHRLLHIAQDNNVKVVLVGEDKQLDAIEHGGCLRYLSRALDCNRIEVIKRQRESWARDAVMQLRDGQAQQALEAFKEKGLLNFSATSDESKSKLVSAWSRFRHDNPGKSTLLLAQRWEDVNQLSDQVRSILQAEGSIGREEVELDCVVSEHRCKYKFASGDRVKFCKNDYRLAVSNGTLGTIEAISQDDEDVTFQVCLDDGRSVTVRKSEYQSEDGRLPLALGYALTVYASQGATVDGDVFVSWTTGMDRSNTYVAGSRHKDSCHWFFNNREVDLLAASAEGQQVSEAERIQTIAQVMSTDRRKFMALEYLTFDGPLGNQRQSMAAHHQEIILN